MPFSGWVRMRAIWALGLAVLSGVGWGQTSPGTGPVVDEPMTTLSVRTRVVEIAAVVKSKDGEVRGGLTKDDFVLKQDGKDEAIRYFSQGSELPLTLALMVDTSGSQRTFIGDETLASDVFFETMLGRKQDRAMLVEFGNNVAQLHGLTPSANDLHLALTALSAHAAAAGGTLLQDAVWVVAKNVLGKETGRKAMVILTDGGDNGSRHSIEEAVEAAQRGDVQIYSVLYSAFEGPGALPSGRGIGSGGRLTVDGGLETLKKLSESTGGQVFTVSRAMSLRQIFAKIGEDLRLQYEVGYTPPADTAPNSYHKLELKAKDKKLVVQARKGFFAQP